MSDIENFVTQGYRNILNREPDPVGFQDFVGAISSGIITKERFLEILKTSGEYKTKPIKNSLKDLFIFISKSMRYGVVCIETGTQFYFDEKDKDLHSTIGIIKYIAIPKDGRLYSFDVNQKHINKCKSFLDKDDESRVNFILGDSVEQLKNKIDIIGHSHVDFVFLDSKDYDEDHMLNEFRIIEPYLNNEYIVCCDDIHNPNSVKYKKAVPYIKERVDLWFEYNISTGLFVGIKNNR